MERERWERWRVRWGEGEVGEVEGEVGTGTRKWLKNEMVGIQMYHPAIWSPVLSRDFPYEQGWQ